MIEKARTVVTDGTGQYKIVDLRPGAYTLTFTPAGFDTVVHGGTELSGSFTATVNVDMKVGAVEDTITVTRETLIVDLQSGTKQQVFGHKVIDGVPNGRLYQSLGAMVPGARRDARVNGDTRFDIQLVRR